MEEREFIARILKGEEKACAEFVATQRPKIFAQCMTLLKEESLAEDLTQETLLRGLKKLPSFQQKSTLGTWLWRIAHNLCVNYLRKQHAHIPLDEGRVSVQECDPSLFRECLEGLPFKQRQVVELFYMQRLSQKEIAQRLRIPCGTVRSRIHYAKKTLRKILED